MGFQLDVIKANFRKRQEAIKWKGQELALLPSRDNYLNLKLIPLVSEAELEKILKPEFLAAGTDFDVAVIVQTYRDTMLNYA